jgi:hypothetical protein
MEKWRKQSLIAAGGLLPIGHVFYKRVLLREAKHSENRA